MNHAQRIVAIGLVALPLAAFAQTANTPGGSAATGTPLEQDKISPARTTPKTTATTPTTANPTGTLNHMNEPGDPNASGKATTTRRQSRPEAPTPTTAPGTPAVPDPAPTK